MQKQLEAIIAGSKLKNEYIRAVIDIRCAVERNAHYRESLERRRKIEQVLPISTLIYFRQTAMKELNELELKKKSTTRSSVSSTRDSSGDGVSERSSWLGFFRRGSQTKPATKRESFDQREDISLEDIRHELETGIETEVKYVARVSFGGFAVGIDFSDLHQKPIASARLRLSSSINFRSDSTQVEFSVESCVIQDKCSIQPAFETILSGLSANQHASFHINGVLDSSKTSVQVRSDPLQINWNEHCMRAMIAYLLSTYAETYMLYPIVLFKSKTKFEVPVSNDVVLHIDLRAPLFVFPEIHTSSSPQQWSYLVFDAGHLFILAKTERGMLTCKTKLSHVGAGMSTSLEEAQRQGKSNSLIPGSS